MMRLPRLSRPRAVPSPEVPRGRTPAAILPSAHASESYRVHACTTALGATDDEPGHPRLEHCLVQVRDERGGVLRSLSIGRSGLGPEAHAHVESFRCAPEAIPVDAAELRRFEQALQDCADDGYRWGERDCCSCVERAFVRGLGRAAPDLIRAAAAELAAVPDPLGPRS